MISRAFLVISSDFLVISSDFLEIFEDSNHVRTCFNLAAILKNFNTNLVQFPTCQAGFYIFPCFLSVFPFEDISPQFIRLGRFGRLPSEAFEKAKLEESSVTNDFGCFFLKT